MHARRSGAEWRAIVRAFERSEQTHEVFCGDRGLNVGSFRGWLYRTRRETSSTVRLVPVDTPQGVTATPVATSDCGHGATSSPIMVMVRDVEVRVAPGSDPAYVAALVRELGRC